MRRAIAAGLVAALCLAIPVAGRASCATPQFDTPLQLAAGSAPNSVATADFDGDGHFDLAVVNSGPGTVSILLGDGTGSFGAATDYTVGSDPLSVAVGDFNGDGHLDLAVSNWISNTVSILLGDGTGRFGAATDFPADSTAGSNPRSVAVGDFNGDGHLDLALPISGPRGSSGPDTVSILLGSGTGGFGAPTSFAVGDDAFRMTVGDFNRDGHLDLAVPNALSGTVSILLGNGTGRFGAATNVAVGTEPNFVAVGDFNGDGHLDLAVAHGGHSVAILLGDGTGRFGTATDFAVGNGASSVAVGDFNGDGHLDLAVGNTGSGSIAILLGDGKGGFGAATDLVVQSPPIPGGVLFVAVADVNGDDSPDLVAANSTDNTVSILLNTCGLATGTPMPSQPCVGDCNASGDVTVNEIVTLVNIALGSAAASACPQGIPAGESVTIGLIIQAVNDALTSCSAP